MKQAIALLIIALAAAAGAIMLAGRTPKPTTPATPEVSLDRIISQLQPIEELATLKVGVSGIVRATQSGQRFWQGESRMVLIARGTGVYSVDLRSLEVKVDGQDVLITLDPPRVTESWIDVEQSVIWERTTGRFMDTHSVTMEAACWSAAGAMVREVAGREHHRQFAMRHAEETIVRAVKAASVDASVRVAWR